MSLFIIALLLTGFSAWAQGQSTVIWYLPHPDDETIGMADSIYQSVLEGNRNYFVFFTKGENSLARHAIKNSDGDYLLLTKQEFGKARARETMAALQILGVESHQVIFLDFPDGSLPLSAAKETIRLFDSLYPGSIHRTVSEQDHHKDHQTLARALASVSTEEDRSIYAEYFHVYIYGTNNQSNRVEKRKIMYPDIKAEALAQFSYFNSDEGRFAIAAISTPALIAGALTSEYEYLDPTTDQNYPQAKRASLGFSISTLDLGLLFPLSEHLNVLGLYDFKTSSGLAELNLKLPDNIPRLQLNVSLGYHFGYNKTYLGSGANFGSYFLKLRHVPHQETRFGFGLTTSLR